MKRVCNAGPTLAAAVAALTVTRAAALAHWALPRSTRVLDTEQ